MLNINPELFSINSWQDYFKKIVSTEFNAIESHLEMAPYRKLGFEPGQKPMESAVGIHVYFEEEPTLILIERPMSMRKHAGQIAFPGGKKDNNDQSLIHTAIRESNEELNIDLHSGIHIGSLAEIYIPVSNFIVHPFVFTHSQKPELQPNIDEVNSVLFIKISEVLSEESKIHQDILLENGSKIKNAPCFKIQEKIIWGATSLMLNELKHRITYFPQ